MTASLKPSRRLSALRAALEGDLPSGSTPGFRAAVSNAKLAGDALPPVSLDGLVLVKCRRCGGTGKYRMAHGWGECSGHGRLGVCVNGKSLTPEGRAEYQRRQAQRSLDARRAVWRALAALRPVTRIDHRELVRALENAELHGSFARQALDACG